MLLGLKEPPLLPFQLGYWYDSFIYYHVTLLLTLLLIIYSRKLPNSFYLLSCNIIINFIAYYLFQKITNGKLSGAGCSNNPCFFFVVILSTVYVFAK